MTELKSILDPNKLEAEVEAGYVRVRYHPYHSNIAIFNYTEKAAYEGHWNSVTLSTRGLIVDLDTGIVLARPFPKFFNLGQTGAPEVTGDTPLLWAYDKADGSLGILWMLDGVEYEDSPYYGLNVATRGSFESDQAIWATHFVKTKWEGLYDDACDMIEDGYTPLVEIIYPENRIVLDYGGAQTLKHLGYIHIDSGAYTGVPEFNRTLSAGDTVEMFPFFHVDEALEALNRKNAEGFVLWLNPFVAVKVKQDDYVELHRVVTGLNKKSVWRAVSAGHPTYLELVRQLPDELYAWAEEVAAELYMAFQAQMVLIDVCYQNVLEYLEDNDLEGDRKALAFAVQNLVPPVYRGYMFSLADSRDITEKLWKSLEPVGGDK